MLNITAHEIRVYVLLGGVLGISDEDARRYVVSFDSRVDRLRTLVFKEPRRLCAKLREENKALKAQPRYTRVSTV